MRPIYYIRKGLLGEHQSGPLLRKVRLHPKQKAGPQGKLRCSLWMGHFNLHCSSLHSPVLSGLPHAFTQLLLGFESTIWWKHGSGKMFWFGGAEEYFYLLIQE